MRLNVVDDLMLNRPLEEIQLSNRRLQEILVVIRNRRALPATKRIEILLLVSLQFQFVIVIDFEPRCHLVLVHRIPHVIFLGEIRHEPVDDAERNARLAVDDAHHFRHVRRLRLEKIQQVLEQ